MARDSLRATLDDFRADPNSADRPYLESMLRRLGYSEKEIQAELDVPAQAPEDAGPEFEAPVSEVPAPKQPTAREYRLVLPSGDSKFWVGEGAPGRQSDAPFEDLQRLEFESLDGQQSFDVDEERLDFMSEPSEDNAATSEAGLWETNDSNQDFGEFEAVEEPVAEPFEQPNDPFTQGDFEPVEDAAFPLDEQTSDLSETPLDTFGTRNVEAASPTRVRVKRVRARSREEAEAKVATKSRRVIKSIPVDIVERWGSGGKQ